MLMADKSSGFLGSDFGVAPGGDGEDDGLAMDYDTFMDLLEEDPSNVNSQNRSEEMQKHSPEDAPPISMPDAVNYNFSQFQRDIQEIREMPVATAVLEITDFKVGESDDKFGSAGLSDAVFESEVLDPSMRFQTEHSSASFREWFSIATGSDSCFTKGTGFSNYSMQGCSTASSFEESCAHQVTKCEDNLDPKLSNAETGVHFGQVNENVDPKSTDISQCLMLANTDADVGNYDGSPRNATSTESPICQSSDGVSDYYYDHSASQSINNSSDIHPSLGQIFYGDEVMVNGEFRDIHAESACCSSQIRANLLDERLDKSFSETLISDFKEQQFNYDGCNYASPFTGNGFSQTDDGSSSGGALNGSLNFNQPFMSANAQASSLMKCSLVAPWDVMHHSVPDMEESKKSRSTCGAGGEFSFSKNFIQSTLSQKLGAYCKDEKEDVTFASKRARRSHHIVDEVTNFPPDGGYLDLNSLEPYMPRVQLPPLNKLDLGYTKNENQNELKQYNKMVFNQSKVSPESVNSDSAQCSLHDEDSDVCIIEDISYPVRPMQSVVHENSIVASQHLAVSDSLVASHHSTFSGSVNYTGLGGARLRAHDEGLVYRVALQDLSQPKAEAAPPDGVLAVPLLRHQRIALSWMVQKETNSFHCSGGILADDQGLGKTVSTIALILKERSPPSRAYQEEARQGEFETLNLDEDDDAVLGGATVKQEIPTSSVQSKGRPAAGTLVVCPTSVLRQWADELQNKVTREANLSFLVYHGSNRTKDPSELAKYDVVLTTYSIVSMEVPKQPFVDKDDDEKERQDDYAVCNGSLPSKRKYAPSSDKKSSKGKKGMDKALFESVARPLAKVGWFRVILDEAQNIKNHRTQVARACWGLRAKRRWCLSGTPIQNTIDDLYSYFRFLRYDPYAVYKSFCSTIKFPISRNPAKGYRKLQAVLKTIMLRRTKGTLLDGEPIITLPPKFVQLKKVEFSEEERDFYSKLESDSRAQFEEYAAAGTVKQNYVNILLMLLRLRQACDHPLLVKKYDSASGWNSVETAKKLPREGKLFLLNCLEGSLAICGICNDPPEDAVVSSCGHVFCNQCICDHLTGDDKQCPATNCKVRLTDSMVFSKAILISSLSGQPPLDSSTDCSMSELSGVTERFFESGSYDSSKIKAALEVLQRLSKQQDSTSNQSSGSIFSGGKIDCPENSSSAHEENISNDMSENRTPTAEKSLRDSRVVGEKAIVFSQWTRMLDLLEARLKKSSIPYRRLDGTMSVAARDKAVKDFNTVPEVSVMIMSLKAASLGLNMVAACHVLLLDLWWNPTTEDQAVDRAHRIGQTRPVKVLRLTVKDTVEDRILSLQQKKREMVANAFGEDETGSRQSRLTVEDLKYLFMA